MDNFEKVFNFSIGREGIYSKDKNDPGGETFMGISRRWNKHWIGWTRIDQCKGNVGQILALSVDTTMLQSVKNFYLYRYWNHLSCDQLPFVLALALFDSALPCGKQDAAIWLQRGMNELGEALRIDGVIGKKTIAASQKYTPRRLANKILSFRLRDHYEKNSHNKYFGGLVLRVAAILAYQ